MNTYGMVLVEGCVHITQMGIHMGKNLRPATTSHLRGSPAMARMEISKAPSGAMAAAMAREAWAACG